MLEFLGESSDVMVPRGPCTFAQVHELCIYMGSLTEALDPALDAWTAANSETMCASRCLASFETSWNMPVLGPAIGTLGEERHADGFFRFGARGHKSKEMDCCEWMATCSVLFLFH